MRLQVAFVAVAALSASAVVAASTGSSLLGGQPQEAASRIGRRQLYETEQMARNPDVAEPSVIYRRSLLQGQSQEAASRIGRRQLSQEAQVEEALAGVSRNSNVKVAQGFDDFVKLAESFSEIDFTSSAINPDGKNPLAFALDFFRISDPVNMNDFDRLSTDLDLYIAFETELRKTGAGGTRFLTETKVVKFFLQFQKARVQVAKRLTVTLPGGVEHQRGKVVSNAKAIGVPEDDIKALQAISVPGAPQA